MNADLFGALRTAVERGATVDGAARSFINAGYDQREVNEAAQALTSGATSLIHGGGKIDSNTLDGTSSKISSDGKVKGKLSIFQKSELPQIPNPQVGNSQFQNIVPIPTQSQVPMRGQFLPNQVQEKNVSRKTSIILITLFIFLIAALILTIIFSDQIIGLLG